jgi:hypothetical protein
MKHLPHTLAVAALLATAMVSPANTYKFEVALDGAQEVPGPGDSDGSGLATLFLNDADNSIVWNITVNNIVLPITGDHIHEAAAGVAGPVVINFGGQLLGGPLVDSDVANILANPTGYYVNVHNADYPAGAIRGQLGRGVLVADVPDSLGLPTVFATHASLLVFGRRFLASRLST